MIRDVTGYKGLVVTTWGRDLDGSLWVGESRPVTTTITCGCNTTLTQRGFFSALDLAKSGWVEVGDTKPPRWWCSFRCLATLDPDGWSALVREVQGKRDRLDRQLVGLLGTARVNAT